MKLLSDFRRRLKYAQIELGIAGELEGAIAPWSSGRLSKSRVTPWRDMEKGRHESNPRVVGC